MDEEQTEEVLQEGVGQLMFDGSIPLDGVEDYNGLCAELDFSQLFPAMGHTDVQTDTGTPAADTALLAPVVMSLPPPPAEPETPPAKRRRGLAGKGTTNMPINSIVRQEERRLAEADPTDTGLSQQHRSNIDALIEGLVKTSMAMNTAVRPDDQVAALQAACDLFQVFEAVSYTHLTLPTN